MRLSWIFLCASRIWSMSCSKENTWNKISLQFLHDYVTIKIFKDLISTHDYNTKIKVIQILCFDWELMLKVVLKFGINTSTNFKNAKGKVLHLLTALEWNWVGYFLVHRGDGAWVARKRIHEIKFQYYSYITYVTVKDGVDPLYTGNVLVC